jgi:hypothetical protein
VLQQLAMPPNLTGTVFMTCSFFQLPHKTLDFFSAELFFELVKN